MKKFISKLPSIVTAMALAAALTGCSQSGSATEQTTAAAQTEAETDSDAEETAESAEAEADTTTEAGDAGTTAAEAQTDAEIDADAAESAAEGAATEETSDAKVRVGSLKGPTTIGIINMMADDFTGANDYEFTIATQASELMAQILSGDLDIALIPANAAATLYNKTEGGAAVIDINTLGVLYCVTGDESIKSVKDLEGKTVILTGQGTTPEYTLKYLLAENDVEAELEFKSEATEVVSALSADTTAIGILPQPFATASLAKNEALHTAFSLSDEWDAVSDGSRMVTGVTVVRKAFLEENEDAVKGFLTDHKAAAAKAVDDVDTTAELVAAKEIIAAAPVAKKAIPLCNIVCIDGEEMKEDLSGYLEVLYNEDPASVGGELPGEDFYLE